MNWTAMWNEIVATEPVFSVDWQTPWFDQSWDASAFSAVSKARSLGIQIYDDKNFKHWFDGSYPPCPVTLVISAYEGNPDHVERAAALIRAWLRGDLSR